MAVTQGTVVKSFVSAIDFLDQRDIDPKVYDQSRDRAFTDILKMVNRYKECTMPTYHNFVNNDVWETSEISAVSSTGLAQIIFTVNTGATFPRVGDLIKTSNANNEGRQGRIQAVTVGSGTATLTVRSVGGNSEPLFATVGDDVQYGSNAFSEKSSAPTNRRYGMTKYFNQVQVFREVDEISDIQKISKIEVNIGGDYHILPYQFIQKKIKFEGDISVQMLMGTKSVTSFSDTNAFLADASSGMPIQTTGGMDWYIRTYGIDDEAAVLGTFNLDVVDEWVDNFIANKAPKEHMCFMSTRPYRLISKYLKNLGSSGVTSVRMNIDGKEFNFEVERLIYAGFTFDFIHVPIFDHPQLVGNILPDISGSIYMVPKDQVDTLENGMQPRIQIRYMASPFGRGVNGFNNGSMAEWRTGAMAEIPTNDDAYLRTNWYAIQGLEMVAVKHCQKYRLVA